ncbi:MAG: hypothetical protein N4A62_15520 [Marinisporobacter sp.]|jgi:hypothetical protein|nr:hypothetical protein [Marinisporobacter sp.]
MKQNNVKPIIVKNDDLSSKQNINTTNDNEYNLDNFNLDFLCNFIIKRCVDPSMTNDEEIKFDNEIIDDLLSSMIGKPVVDSELSPNELKLRGNLHIALIQMKTIVRHALKNVTQNYSAQWNAYLATGKTSINFEELLKNELHKVEFYHSKNILGLSFDEMFKMIDAIKKIRDDFKINTSSKNLLSVSLGHAQLKAHTLLKEMEKSPSMKQFFTQVINNNTEEQINEFLTYKQALLRENNIDDKQIDKELLELEDVIKNTTEKFNKILEDHDNLLTKEALSDVKALEKDILSNDENDYDIASILNSFSKDLDNFTDQF